VPERTRVYKFDNQWWVHYFVPYSGIMYAEFPTWEEALDEALSVELYKAWL